MRKIVLRVGVSLIVGLLGYAVALSAYESYWQQKCLRATFLRAVVAYNFDVYCQNDVKSLRIETKGKAAQPETQPVGGK